MTKPKASKRRRKSPLWDSDAFSAACDVALHEYMRLLGGGRAPRIPATFFDLIREFAPLFGGHLPSGAESGLIGRVSPETLKKIHRLVVQDLHPDKGGDVEAMKAANAAWEEIRKRRGM